MEWARGVAAGYTNINRHLLLLRSCVDSCSSHVFHSVHCSLSLEATLNQHIFVEASLCFEQYCVNLTVLCLRTKGLVSVKRPEQRPKLALDAGVLSEHSLISKA